MKDKLPYYIHCFTHLKRDSKNSGAPHKPILLLSIIDLFEKEILSDNHIYILLELEGVAV
jgi:putative restriction endonuclease